jgi:hypothetical protein
VPVIGHVLPRPQKWVATDTIIDIGPGIRPVRWHVPKRHICVEPHGPYAEVLRDAGFETIQTTALHFLEHAEVKGATVQLIDVIEHMDRAAGELVVALLHDSDAAQVIVFTPNGFMPQEGDAWGMGGEHWQKHRSGWTPADFPGWDIEPWGNSFFAIRTREKS